jgi:hypothetical protein
MKSKFRMKKEWQRSPRNVPLKGRFFHSSDSSLLQSSDNSDFARRFDLLDADDSNERARLITYLRLLIREKKNELKQLFQ